MGQHDSSYHLFFSHIRMVRDLLLVILGEHWVELLDLASGERVPNSFTSRRHKKRESDIIWKFRRRDNDEPVYVYLLLEFQSRPDRYMPVRMMTYMGLFFEYLIAEGRLPASGKLPLVIPVVIYNGMGPWGPAQELSELIERLDSSADQYIPRLRYRLVHEAKVPMELLEGSDSPVADLFRLERSLSWEEMIAGLSRVREHVGPEEASLLRAFEAWAEKVIIPRLGVSPDEIPEHLSLEDVETMLAERIDEWNRKLVQKGRKEGRSEGREEGRKEGRKQGRNEGRQETSQQILLRLLEKKFGVLPEEARDRIAQTEPELLLEWIEHVISARSLGEVFGDA